MRASTRRLLAGLLPQAGFLGIGQLASALGGLVGIKLLTSLVSPEVYGQAALLLGLGTLGRNFLCSPVLLASLRFFPEAKAAGKVRDLRRVLGRLLVAGFGTTAFALILGGHLWSHLKPEGLPALGFLAVAVLLGLEVAQSLETGLLNADLKQGTYAAWTGLSSWARPLIGAGFVLLLGGSPQSIIAGFATGLALAHVLFHRETVYGDTHAQADFTWSAATQASVLRYAMPLMPLAVLGWVMSLGDRYILAALSSATEVGLYAAAYGLGSQPLIMIGGVLHNTFRPLLFDAVARGDQVRERRVFLLFFGTMLTTAAVGGVGVALAADWLARVFLGSAFWEAAPLIPWLAGAYAIQNVQQVFETEIYAQKNTHLLLIMHGATAVAALALYLTLIPPLGARGAALGTFLSMAVSFVAAAWLSDCVRRFLRRPGGDAREF